MKDQRKTSVDTTLSPDENHTDTMVKDRSREGACEKSIQTDENNSKHHRTFYKELKKYPEKMNSQ